MNKMKIPGSAIFGLILIGVGVISILNTTGVIADIDIFEFWPAILILFGVKSLLDHRSNSFFGLILCAIGGMLLADNLGFQFVGGIETGEVIIPAVIILIGLNFILPKSKTTVTMDSETFVAPGATVNVTKEGNKKTVTVDVNATVKKDAEPVKATEAPVPPTPPTPPTPEAPEAPTTPPVTQAEEAEVVAKEDTSVL